MAKGANKGGKKGIGRSKRNPSSVRYFQSQRWINNKVRRIVKHMMKFPLYKPFNLSQQIADRVNIKLEK